jgi:hypothetical protein
MERWRRTASAVVRRLSQVHWRRIAAAMVRRLWQLRRLPTRVKAGAAGAAIILLVVGSILFVRNPAGPFGKIEPMPSSTGAVSRIPVLGPGHRYLYFPISARVTPGLKYRYVLSTHCGLDYPTGPDFDGSFWDSVDPTQRNKFTNPPPGFADPDDGYMILAAPNTAEFHASAGGVAIYTRRTKGLIAGDCN